MKKQIRYQLRWNGFAWGNDYTNLKDLRKEAKRLLKVYPDSAFIITKVISTYEEIEFFEEK